MRPGLSTRPVDPSLHSSFARRRRGEGCSQSPIAPAYPALHPKVRYGGLRSVAAYIRHRGTTFGQDIGVDPSRVSGSHLLAVRVTPASFATHLALARHHAR